MLQNYCMIVPSDDGDVIVIIELVQLSVAKWLEARGTLEGHQCTFFRKMGDFFYISDFAHRGFLAVATTRAEKQIGSHPSDPGGRLTCRRLITCAERTIDSRPT